MTGLLLYYIIYWDVYVALKIVDKLNLLANFYNGVKANWIPFKKLRLNYQLQNVSKFKEIVNNSAVWKTIKISTKFQCTRRPYFRFSPELHFK